ncbi:MAG TPA: hypothetical protein VNM90_20150 [Haliangium sp.]|nr:hypothetical protein [Haliangium sp.]
MSKLSDRTISMRYVERDGEEQRVSRDCAFAVLRGRERRPGDTAHTLGSTRADWGQSIVLLRDGKAVAEASIGPALGSRFQEMHRAPADALQSAAYLADVRASSDRDRSLLVYLALRRARLDGHHAVVSHLREGAWPERMGWSRLGLAPSIAADGAVHQVCAQRLELALLHAFDWSIGEGNQIEPSLFADELGETLERWILSVYERGFFRAVHERRLTREQYLYATANMHQFVRWTTRLLGRAVAVSHDKAFRNQFLHHLQDEVNHEVIIEKDLEHLGVDLHTYLERIPANRGTRLFMAVQESIIGFHQDPLLFLASPLAAEGIAAHLDQRFLDDLIACVAGWGVEHPRRAIRFLESHISFDGGEHGHWEEGLGFVAERLRTEEEFQRFLGVLRGSMEGLSMAYDSFGSDLAIFSLRDQPARVIAA